MAKTREVCTIHSSSMAKVQRSGYTNVRRKLLFQQCTFALTMSTIEMPQKHFDGLPYNEFQWLS